jgi:hypothetical protein
MFNDYSCSLILICTFCGMHCLLYLAVFVGALLQPSAAEGEDKMNKKFQQAPEKKGTWKKAVVRLVKILDSAKNTFSVCPMLCVLFLSARLRAINVFASVTDAAHSLQDQRGSSHDSSLGNDNTGGNVVSSGGGGAAQQSLEATAAIAETIEENTSISVRASALSQDLMFGATIALLTQLVLVFLIGLAYNQSQLALSGDADGNGNTVGAQRGGAGDENRSMATHKNNNEGVVVLREGEHSAVLPHPSTYHPAGRPSVDSRAGCDEQHPQYHDVNNKVSGFPQADIQQHNPHRFGEAGRRSGSGEMAMKEGKALLNSDMGIGTVTEKRERASHRLLMLTIVLESLRYFVMFLMYIAACVITYQILTLVPGAVDHYHPVFSSTGHSATASQSGGTFFLRDLFLRLLFQSSKTNGATIKLLRTHSV